MTFFRAAAGVVSLTLLLPLFPAARQASTPTALTVAGDVASPLALARADLAGMTRTRVELRDGAKTTTYEGVLVSEILAKAGVPLGPSLHGADLTQAVLASASDGYQIVFSIGELDPALSRSEIIVADTADGHGLAAPQGPLRLVVPKDTRGARSVRMLERLDVVRVKR